MAAFSLPLLQHLHRAPESIRSWCYRSDLTDSEDEHEDDGGTIATRRNEPTRINHQSRVEICAVEVGSAPVMPTD
jgi:hypothetical protein